MAIFERFFLGNARAWVGSVAHGDILEIAVGTGRNLPFYRADARITGIELSSQMLLRAQGRAQDLRREVDLRVGDAEALDFPDASFDTVVSTLSLCTIPGVRRAVVEAKRVLRPGGYLVLVEHVRSPVVLVRIIQELIEPMRVRSEGDHLTREPLEIVLAERFEVLTCQRSRLGIMERLQARKPTAGDPPGVP